MQCYWLSWQESVVFSIAVILSLKFRWCADSVCGFVMMVGFSEHLLALISALCTENRDR